MCHKLNKIDQLIVSALDLNNQNQTPFTRQDLAIAAWSKWPQSFGIEGWHKTYPDTTKVYISLMGKRGMVSKGLLRNVNTLYELTEQGLSYADKVYRLLQGVKQAKAQTTIIPTVEEQEILFRLLADPAHEKVRTGQRLEVTASEGLGFYNGHADCIITTLRSLADRLDCEGSVDLVLDNGQVVTWQEMSALVRTEQWLSSRFKHLFKVMSRRKDNGSS